MGSKTVQRAGLYVRISQFDIDEADPERRRSLGTKRQEGDCRAEASRRGWKVHELYCDDDRSAFSGKRRPAYEALCEDIKNHVIDAVIVWDVDRLHRNPRELEDFVTLIESTGATVVSVSGGDYDLENADGRFKARIMGAVARKESEDKSRRLRRKHAELVATGKPNGERPYGYKRVGLEHDPGAGGADTRRQVAEPAEAAVVAEMVDCVARGETLSAIAGKLNARGVPTRQGGPWLAETVAGIVANPAHIGRRTHHGQDVGKADWPAIVDEVVWRRAKAILSDPARRKRRTPRRYLLTGGLAVCGVCKGPLRSKQQHSAQGEPVGSYACKPSTQGGCGGVTIRADHVEQLVKEAVIAAVEKPKFARELWSRQGGDRRSGVDAERISAELDALADAFGAGSLTPREYFRIREGMVARLEAAQANLTVGTMHAAVGRFAGQPGALREWWDHKTTTLDQRQAVVRSVVREVRVDPVGKGAGRVFDPDRVHIESLI